MRWSREGWDSRRRGKTRYKYKYRLIAELDDKGLLRITFYHPFKTNSLKTSKELAGAAGRLVMDVIPGEVLEKGLIKDVEIIVERDKTLDLVREVV
ncbi:hypothetical protein [Pyrococcus kukulkanii]|uniref:hypothetical protein n=1 Tax=Pyrococcus kukulkanii TaxID=1609559 RepID=UPI0035619C1D